MRIDGIRSLVTDCYEEGCAWWQPFRKVQGITTAQGFFTDLSMASGNPRPNYYTGTELTSTLFNGAYGIWHGGNVSPSEKYLHNILLLATSTGVVPAKFILCDYLLFYPLIDMDSMDEQVFVNTVTLPRYADGYGVQCCLVATNPYVGGAYFFINYTNHLGESGRISRVVLSNSATNISTLVNSGVTAGMWGPFIPLAPGDYVRSVQSVTFLSGNGGLAALTLLKPIAEVYLREVNAPGDWDLVRMGGGKLPKIVDGAYLNFLVAPNGTMAGQYVIGDLTFIWR